MYLDLSISNGIVSTKFYEKGDDFNFEIYSEIQLKDIKILLTL